MKKKFFVLFLAGFMILGAILNTLAAPMIDFEVESGEEMPSSGTNDSETGLMAYTNLSNFNQDYTLSGNMAEDIALIAFKQVGRTQTQMGYNMQWCAAFVSDCARIAGIPTSIIKNAKFAYPSYFDLSDSQKVAKENIKNGDLCFWSGGHVGIVYNGKVVSGNNQSEGESESTVKYYADQYAYAGTATYYRPNYTTVENVDYATITPDEYYINNNGYRINVVSDSQAKGSLNASNSAKSKFSIVKDGSYYKITSTSSSNNYVINSWWTGSNSSTQNGDEVTLYKNTGDASQRWYFEECNGGYLIHPGDATYLSITRDTSTNKLYVKTTTKDSNQIWALENAKQYTIYFNANGGSVSTSSKTVTYATTYGTLPTPTRTGYAFAGWYTAASGGSQVTSSTNVSITANQTLYAQWNRIWPGKPSISVASTALTEDQNLQVSWNSVANCNYYELHVLNLATDEQIFIDWSVYDTSYSVNFPVGSYSVAVAAINSEVSGDATWTYSDWVNFTVSEKYYTISYNANGGENAPAAQTKRHGQDITITTEIPTRAGYTFKGWAGYPQSGVELVPGQICHYNYSWTFYAVWLYIMPGKPSIHTIQSQYYSHDEVTLWWDDTENTTHYNLYFDKQDGSEWVRAYTQHYAESGFSHSFESGKYRVQLQSTNSDYYMPDHSTWPYTDSDWYYFDVIDVPVTGITLDQTTALLKNGETLTLTATVTPSDAHNKAVAWSSSDTAVATVSASGVVTAVGTGVTTIIATTEDGGKTASCEVTVKKKFVASGTCGDNLAWTLDDNGTLTISGTGKMYDFTSSSNAPWYTYRSSITTAIIEDGVTSIGKAAFFVCSSLTNVTIPDSVTSIGGFAFDGCSSLTNVTIPDSVTSIGDSAFRGCSSLTDVTIPDSVTSIGDSAFSGCSSLTGIWVDENNTNYSSDEKGVLFDKAKTKLIQYSIGITETTYEIPDSVTSIGNHTFYGCSSLTDIKIPDNVTSIGQCAFYGCSSLTNVTIPDSVTSIGDHTFYGCSSLTDVTIPDSVTSIGVYAFHGCSSLTDIKIPDNVTSIGAWAFYGCSSLTNVTIPDSVTSIGQSAFYGCSSLTDVTIPDSVTSIGVHAFYGCSSLTNVTIPDSVTSIGMCAFYGCSSLTDIKIPDNVTSIGVYAFYGCSSLTDVYYSGSEAQWNEISFGRENQPLLNATIHFNYNSAVSVTSVVLDKTVLNLAVGETLTLTATVTPSDAHNKAVAWSSSDTAVATVSASGVVTAVGTGVTTISATTEDGHKTASCVITVKEKTQSVVLSPIAIKNTAYEVLEAIPVGSFIAEVSLTNNTYNGVCHILLATYDRDGRLLHTRYVYANPTVGQTISFGTEFSNADETIATIKAFALSDLRSFSVLCPASER